MREFITGDVVANWVRMTQQVHSGTIILVEGDSDARLYSKVLARSSSVVINAVNKQNVIDSLIILDADKTEGIVGIIDADCYRLLKVKLPSENLLLTDTHDLETMLIDSQALEQVLAEHGSQKKLSRLDKSVRQTLVDSALPYGYLRMISTRDGLCLDFEGIKYGKYTDRKELETDVLKLIIATLSRSEKSGIDPQSLSGTVQELKGERHDPWQVCCGHDMIQILSLGLRVKFGTNNAQQVHPQIIERALHIGYTPECFSRSRLCRSMKDWEKLHNKFRILPIGV